jgi:hypothetical protein
MEIAQRNEGRAFIRNFYQFESEWLSANIKLTFYKALIRSVIVYVCPAWEFAADGHPSKFQRLYNKVLRTIRKFPRFALVRQLHMVFQAPYIYDYIKKLCRQQTEVVHNHENANVRDIGKGDARHKKYKRLKLGRGQSCDRSKWPGSTLTWATWVRTLSAVPGLDWRMPFLYCTYIYSRVICKTVTGS